jgi:cysteine desulfurase/selenocysteine lyase
MTNFTKHFPSLSKNHPLVYLDSAASSQTCAPALQAMNDYYTKYRSNIHRGLYPSAVKASEAYEQAREQVASFIGAKPEEIIFTSGTTHALNQLAHSLSPRLSHRDNVVLTRLEHHANLVPWQQMAKHYGFSLRFIELTKKGELDIASAKKLIDTNTKIVSFSLVSNVLGCVAPAQKIITLAKDKRALTIIDAAQAVAHLPINVKKLGVDFLVFSGHKVYGPTGIGVLYGKKTLLEESLEPFFFGGDMVKEVSYTSSTWQETPAKFEAGTPNIAGAIGLGSALAWIKKIGFKAVQQHEKNLMNYTLQKLSPEVAIIGQTKNRVGVISFTIPDIHPHDIADILGSMNICIRAGHHCAEPLHHHLGLTATARASIGLSTTKKDIDALVKGLVKIKKMFA